MSITGPDEAVEGSSVTIIGSGFNLVSPPELVATNGVDTITLAQAQAGAMQDYFRSITPEVLP